MADNINVTASVNPDPSDLQFDYQTTTAIDPVSQYTQIDYRITYGSRVFYQIPITLEANWEEGVIQDGGGSADIVDYVDNSATNAYGDSAPVIDPVNKKITWTMNSFPAQTLDQTVTFSLRTNRGYTGAKPVQFRSNAELTSVTLALPEIGVTKNYLYNPLLEPTPTQIALPTLILTPSVGVLQYAPTSTPVQPTSPVVTQMPIITPTPSKGVSQFPPTVNLGVLPLVFKDIALRSLTASQIKLFVETTEDTTLRVFYGQGLSNISESIESSSFSTKKEIVLDDLTPDTAYFVKIISQNKKGETITSNIYSFKTAKSTFVPKITENSLIITSGNIILSDPLLYAANNKKLPIIVLPKQQVFEFKFHIDTGSKAKRVRVFIRNNNVLGINNSRGVSQYASTDNYEVIDVVELELGEFVGKLKSPLSPGNYELIARIYDDYGNIAEQKIADLRITENLRVIDEKNQNPIEAAQVFIYYFNPRTKEYELLPPLSFPVKNPVATDIKGEIAVILPQGKYLAKVNALGYKNKQIEFAIGMNPGDIYPIITLTKESFNIITTTQYYSSILNDSVSESTLYIKSLANSSRFFELNALVAIFLLVILTIYSFAARLNVPVHSLLDFIFHHHKMLLNDTTQHVRMTGKIFDENTSQILSDADIYLIDGGKNKIVNHTRTDVNGIFSFIKLNSGSYKIEVMKDGYTPVVFTESDWRQEEQGSYIFHIKKHNIDSRLFEKVLEFARKFLSLLFETLLIISLLFELSFGFVLGWLKVLPFLIVSLINLYVWILHLTHLKNEKNMA